MGGEGAGRVGEAHEAERAKGGGRAEDRGRTEGGIPRGSGGSRGRRECCGDRSGRTVYGKRGKTRDAVPAGKRRRRSGSVSCPGLCLRAVPRFRRPQDMRKGAFSGGIPPKIGRGGRTRTGKMRGGTRFCLSCRRRPDTYGKRTPRRERKEASPQASRLPGPEVTMPRSMRRRRYQFVSLTSMCS